MLSYLSPLPLLFLANKHLTNFLLCYLMILFVYPPTPQVDLAACAAAGIKVVRVPTYSPTSVAEHALAMMMVLNRYWF